MLFGWVVVIAFGYLLKITPKYPNDYIPFGTIIFGILFYSLAIYPEAAPNYPLYPQVILGSIGLIMSLFAWVVHRKFLKKWIDDKIWKADGNTDIIVKD